MQLVIFLFNSQEVTRNSHKKFPTRNSQLVNYHITFKKWEQEYYEEGVWKGYSYPQIQIVSTLVLKVCQNSKQLSYVIRHKYYSVRLKGICIFQPCLCSWPDMKHTATEAGNANISNNNKIRKFWAWFTTEK